MANPFFERPILNSPYECPARHWELDSQGQPTQRIVETRRKAEFITPIPKPKKQKAPGKKQKAMVFDEGKGLSTQDQQYDLTSNINDVRSQVELWRSQPESLWGVTPETARLLKHWRHHEFNGVRPFFCQIEAVETAIWLTEVAPHTTTKLASRELIVELLQSSAKSIPGHKFAMPFLRTEWEQVVDAWQLDSWEAYRDVARLGRKTRLSEAQRRTLWSIFAIVLAGLKERSLITESSLFTKLASVFEKAEGPFKFAVVDEAQDISIAQLRFLAALAGKYPNGLFFAGDQGQRIFQQPFSWKSLGVDVRGRSRTLRVNYRTSHQIRMQADRLLGAMVSDVDGNTEDRSDTVSVFNGPLPEIRSFPTEAKESAAVGAWIKSHISNGMQPHEIGLFVRSDAQLKRAHAAAKVAGILSHVLDEKVEIASGQMSIATMHLAKGMEFRAVAVMACDDEVIPLQERIETVGDDSDLQEVYDTERHLLYVACTRARDHLLVTCVEPGSEFLGDIDVKSRL